MRKKITILAAFVMFLITIAAVLLISYEQASLPVPTRCAQINGTCQTDCAGYNFADLDRKKSDCQDGLICCLPH